MEKLNVQSRKENPMRIVTRPDFDGIVCAALLYDAEEIDQPIRWAEPNELQKGFVEIFEGDIIANLPYHPNCTIWFDHHVTNRPDTPFTGLYKLAPSAAGLIYEYYRGKFHRNYDELIRQTDRIDSADLTLDEVLAPEKYPYVLLSMTVSGRDDAEEPYWNHLIQLIRRHDIDAVMADPEVTRQCARVIAQNKRFTAILKENTRLHGHVTITDFRTLEKVPNGNRFMVYSLYPEAVVSVRIRYDGRERRRVVIGVGHSIFNLNCRVNVGLMLTRFGGGGHRGAGSCTVPAEAAAECLESILATLTDNEPNE
jgi:hypothetical protein